MYKIFVSKIFTYSNVIIEKLITIESPWTPRIGETIDTASFRGNIKEVIHRYGGKAGLSIYLEEYKTDEHCFGFDLAFDTSYCDAIRAYTDPTRSYDGVIVHQKGSRYFDDEDEEWIENEDVKLDEKAFDEMFKEKISGAAG
jgi:hypothetical protein